MQELKLNVFDLCDLQLNTRIERLKAELAALKESAESDTKSSMGDKYETGREMINLEKGKISAQLSQAGQMADALKSIDIDKQMTEVQFGALVKTNVAIYFVSIGLGNIDTEGLNVFAVSAASPIGQAMLGKKQGESFQMAGKTQEIIEIS